jgi:hypothetical protein
MLPGSAGWTAGYRVAMSAWRNAGSMSARATAYLVVDEGRGGLPGATSNKRH